MMYFFAQHIPRLTPVTEQHKTRQLFVVLHLLWFSWLVNVSCSHSEDRKQMYPEWRVRLSCSQDGCLTHKSPETLFPPDTRRDVEGKDCEGEEERKGRGYLTDLK